MTASRKATTIAVTLTVLLALVVAATIWHQWGRAERSGPIRLLLGDPQIYVYESGDQAPLGLSGDIPVTYDPETRCLYVLDRQGDMSLVIWPRDSRPEQRDGKRGVRVRGVGVVLEGDTITEATIGIVALQDDEFSIAAAVRELGACQPPSGSIVVFYQIDQVQPG